MKAVLLVLSALFAFQAFSHATTLGLRQIRMPVVFDGDEEPVMQIIEVPMVINTTNEYEGRYAAICHAFVPPTLFSAGTSSNINVAAEYGITVKMDYAPEAKGARHWIITVDASKASVPIGFPFTVEQVLDSVLTCINLTTPQVPEDERIVAVEIKKPAK